MSCCSVPVPIPSAMPAEGSARVTKANEKSRIEHLLHERIMANSSAQEDGTYKTEFIVPDMHCAACIGTIERELVKAPPVEQVRANLSMKTVSIVWDPAKGRVTEPAARLEALGYQYHLADNTEKRPAKDKTGQSLLLALAIAGFAAANIMLLSVSVWSGADYETAQLFHLISGIIAIPAVAIAGQPFFRSALKALRAGRLNMDVPISLAVVLALGMSVFESLTGGEEAYFDASVTLLFFLLIGRYLDHLMRKKARGAVERLSSLSAKDGVLVDAQGEITHIAVKDIKPGMRLRIFAGERFPVNGEVHSGRTEIDRSHVTGESDPVLVEKGELIEAGTLNLTAAIDVKATSSAQNSFLGEMRKMMAAAEQGRGQYVRIADRMAQIYAPAVHLLAFIAFVAWMIASGGDWHLSIYTAIAVLIVTCPCALGLAVPVAHVIGANRLMQNGILMRDGTALERLATIDSVVFDKTGTLTSGTPKVISVSGLDDENLPVLKALASSSTHPVAKAVDQFVGGQTGVMLEAFKEIPGCGVEAQYQGQTIRLGKPEWVAEISNPERSAQHSAQAQEWPGETTVSFAIAGSPMAHFCLHDEIRQGAAKAVSELEKGSLRLEILSGDTPAKVRQTADAIGIANFQARQTPADKIHHMEALREAGRKPLMVGDGINDAPALAAGHVSMVPASASDVGRHSADFVFTRPSLLAVPLAVDIARFTDKIVRQNFGLAIVYNCIAVPLAMAGFVTPLIAAIAMSASSILVVANSFRINFTARGKAGKRNISATTSPAIVEVTS